MTQRTATVPERLLECATRLFAERGYEGTSVQQVVEAAGLTKGAMYHYFASKDDLLAQIYRRLLSSQTQSLEAIVAGPGTVLDRLHAAATDVVRTSLENLDDARIYRRSMHQLSPGVQTQVRDQRRRYHDLFKSLIVAGLESGDLVTPAPVDIVVHYFFGAVHHLGEWYRPQGSLDPAGVGRHYADLLVASLTGAATMSPTTPILPTDRQE